MKFLFYQKSQLRIIFWVMLAFVTLTGCKDDPILPPSATRDNNLAFGNPSRATTADMNNYLLSRSQYTLSYNNAKGIANWVSWHLSTAWKGSAPRSNSFRTDPLLPANFNIVSSSRYTNSGFDRGHMCPSDDRDSTTDDNQATFYMTNIIPQAPNNNQITWKALEDYCRALMYQGNELYIIAGGYGQGGTGDLGGVTQTIGNGTVSVPQRVWKIAVVLPIGANDPSRVSTTTRIIAVDMPNTNAVNAANKKWGDYRVSVDDLEAATGFDFLSVLPASIQSGVEGRVDTGPTQ